MVLFLLIVLTVVDSALTVPPRLTISPAKEVIYYQDGDEFNITCHGEYLPTRTNLNIKSIHGDNNTLLKYGSTRNATSKSLAKNVMLTKNENSIKFYCALVVYESATDKYEEKYVSKYITFVLKETDNATKDDEKNIESGVNTETGPEIAIAPAKDVTYFKDGDQQHVSCTGRHLRQNSSLVLMQVNNSEIHKLNHSIVKYANSNFASTLTFHGRDNGSKVYCAVEDYNDHTNQFEVKFTSANITFMLNTSSEPEVTIAPAKDVIYYKDGDQQRISCTGRHLRQNSWLYLIYVNKSEIYNPYAKNDNFEWQLTLHESDNGSKVYCVGKDHTVDTKQIEVKSAHITFILSTSSVDIMPTDTSTEYKSIVKFKDGDQFSYKCTGRNMRRDSKLEWIFRNSELIKSYSNRRCNADVSCELILNLTLTKDHDKIELHCDGVFEDKIISRSKDIRFIMVSSEEINLFLHEDDNSFMLPLFVIVIIAVIILLIIALLCYCNRKYMKMIYCRGFKRKLDRNQHSSPAQNSSPVNTNKHYNNILKQQLIVDDAVEYSEVMKSNASPIYAQPSKMEKKQETYVKYAELYNICGGEVPYKFPERAPYAKIVGVMVPKKNTK